jgi:hypothetical protein
MSEMVTYTWLTGTVCGRCMESIPRGGDMVPHMMKQCTLKPTCFIVVPAESDKPEAMMRARMFGHSAADAAAIVKTEAEMSAMKRS